MIHRERLNTMAEEKEEKVVSIQIHKDFMEYFKEKKHINTTEDLEFEVSFVIRKFIEEKQEEKRQLLDDYTQGFIWGYAIGKGCIPNNTTMACVKWRIPTTVKAEALLKMRELLINLD